MNGRPAAPARSLLCLLAVAAVVLPFYWWTASTGLPLGLGDRHDAPYDLLARALSRGHLHLDVEPMPELFQLVDPYEPGRNAWLREHDLSLYHGRYYLYFGVVPAALVFAPWRLLGLGDFPEPAATLLFGFGAFVVSALLLRRLLRDHARPVPTAALAAAMLALAVCNVVPYLLRGSNVYDVAITAGLFFSLLAAWLFLGAEGPTARLALGGLCLGLAVGCRPNLIFLAPVLPLLARGPAAPGGRPAWTRSVLAVALPLVGCLLLLAAYNHARFDSWTEFGTTYQLVGARRISRLDYRTVPLTLYYLFLAPPALTPDFPHLLPSHPWPFAFEPPDGYFVDSRTTGLLFHAPLVLVLLAAPRLLRDDGWREVPLLRRRLLALVGCGLGLPLLTSLAFSSVAMRFEADFLALLLIPALLLWLDLAARMAETRRWLPIVATGLLFGWSLAAGLALSITGMNDNLRRGNPALFASLERRFEPLRVGLGRLLDPEGRLQARLRLALPRSATARREPFVSWGRADAYDVLWARQSEPGLLELALDTSAARATNGAAPAGGSIRLAPARFHDVLLDLDRVRGRVRVAVDGRTALQLDGRLVALHPNRLWIGRGPRGHGAPELGQFSGVMIPDAMVQAGRPGLDSLPALAAGPALLLADTAALPPRGTAGQLAVRGGRPGAWLYTGTEWRWVPATVVDGVLAAVALDDGPAGGVQPLLVSGDGTSADLLFARHLPGGRARLLLARWSGDGWRVLAEAGPVRRTGEPATLALDRLDRLATVRLGGVEVLRATIDLPPLRVTQLRLSGLPAGIPLPGP